MPSWQKRIWPEDELSTNLTRSLPKANCYVILSRSAECNCKRSTLVCRGVLIWSCVTSYFLCILMHLPFTVARYIVILTCLNLCVAHLNPICNSLWQLRIDLNLQRHCYLSLQIHSTCIVCLNLHLPCANNNKLSIIASANHRQIFIGQQRAMLF